MAWAVTLHHQRSQSSRNNAEIWPTTEINLLFLIIAFTGIFIFFHPVHVALIFFSDLLNLQKDESYEQVGLGKLEIKLNVT